MNRFVRIPDREDQFYVPFLLLAPGPGRESGTKKEHKPKLLSPDILQWGRGLPRERVGAKKFGMSLETREIKLFWRDIPGFCRDIPPKKRPKSLRKKSLGSIFGP